MRRDSSPLASRTVQQALGMLTSSASPEVAAPALAAIFAVLLVLPISVRQQAGGLEAGLAELLAGRGGVQLPGAAARQAAARCLALIPRALQGSTEAWSNLFRRSLLSLADATDAVFMGLEEPSLVVRAR